MFRRSGAADSKFVINSSNDLHVAIHEVGGATSERLTLVTRANRLEHPAGTTNGLFCEKFAFIGSVSELAAGNKKMGIKAEHQKKRTSFYCSQPVSLVFKSSAPFG